jgi:hypothetical protein
MGFRSLQHLKARRSTYREPCRSPLRSALRVWLPSRRLTPSKPAPVLFHTSSALGIRPSELSPLERYPPRFRDQWTHVPFLPPVFPPPKRRAGPTGRGFWAFTLSRVPGSRTGVNSPTAGCSLGFHPSRAFRRKPCPSSHSGSSHALPETRPRDRTSAAPRSINRSPLGFDPDTRQAEYPGPSNPSRVFAPTRSRPFEQVHVRAMNSPHVAPHIAADSQHS